MSAATCRTRSPSTRAFVLPDAPCRRLSRGEGAGRRRAASSNLASEPGDDRPGHVGVCRPLISFRRRPCARPRFAGVHRPLARSPWRSDPAGRSDRRSGHRLGRHGRRAAARYAGAIVRFRGSLPVRAQRTSIPASANRGSAMGQLASANQRSRAAELGASNGNASRGIERSIVRPSPGWRRTGLKYEISVFRQTGLGTARRAAVDRRI